MCHQTFENGNYEGSQFKRIFRRLVFKIFVAIIAPPREIQITLRGRVPEWRFGERFLDIGVKWPFADQQLRPQRLIQSGRLQTASDPEWVVKIPGHKQIFWQARCLQICQYLPNHELKFYNRDTPR